MVEVIGCGLDGIVDGEKKRVRAEGEGAFKQLCGFGSMN